MLYGKVMMATYGVWPHISSFPSTAPKPINHCTVATFLLKAGWYYKLCVGKIIPFISVQHLFHSSWTTTSHQIFMIMGVFWLLCRSFVSRHPPLKPAVVGGCTFTDLVVTIWIISDFSCILFPLVCTQSAKWSRYIWYAAAWRHRTTELDCFAT